MSFKKNEGYTIVAQAKCNVAGFSEAYTKLVERLTIDQKSNSLIENYGRNIAYLALHLNSLSHKISVDEINSYLYHLLEAEKRTSSYFKQTVCGLRYWFRLFDMPDAALKMPRIKHVKSLPVVLSKEECKLLFKASKSLKHRFFLAFTYSAGLRLSEVRLMKIADVDLFRKQIHIRMGKGKKDRYVPLSCYIASRFSKYIAKFKPHIYLFEGATPGKPLTDGGINYLLKLALMRTDIKKTVSLHTLRHSYATHLLEDGLDIQSIQKLLGHTDIRATLTYIHIAQIKPKSGFSPLDTLYNFPHE